MTLPCRDSGQASACRHAPASANHSAPSVVLTVGLERFNNARGFFPRDYVKTTLGAIAVHEFLNTFAVEKRSPAVARVTSTRSEFATPGPGSIDVVAQLASSARKINLSGTTDLLGLG
jgi:hypothetical protein